MSDCECSCHDNVVSGLINSDDICKIREAVCVMVEKVYDHCKEKDCIENEVVEFRDPNIQDLIDNALKVRTKDIEVQKVFADVEEIPFKKGFYTVDVRYRIKLTVEFCLKQHGELISCDRVGFINFSKTVVLFGSDGKVKIFRTKYLETDDDCTCVSAKEQDNLPIAKIEVADPIVLNTAIKRIRCKPRPVESCDCDCDVEGAEEIEDRGNHWLPPKRVVVSIGLFSIIKLLRKVQLLIPAFSFCYPNKECVAATEDNPCDLFDTIDFPVDAFFPRQIYDFPGAEE